MRKVDLEELEQIVDRLENELYRYRSHQQTDSELWAHIERAVLALARAAEAEHLTAMAPKSDGQS